MATHSKLSPSSRHRWSKCPGSIRECEKYPDTENKYSVDGSKSHLLLETCLLEKKNAVLYVGQSLTYKEELFVIDEDRADRVQIAIDYVNHVLNNDPMAVIKTESRVDLFKLTGRNDLSGTIDIQLFYGNTLEIIDYKDGFNEVKFDQLEQYAVGAITDFPKAEIIKLTIIQPKLIIKGFDPIKSVLKTRDDIKDIAIQIVQEAERTDLPDAPLIAGEHCNFCKAKQSCSARFNLINEKLECVDDEDLINNVSVKNPSTMTNEQLFKLMECAPLIRDILETAEEEVKKRLNEGELIQGLKLVNGRGSRIWAYPEEETERILIKMGIPKSSIYESKMISPAKAEKISWTKKDGAICKLSPRQLQRLESEYVTRLEGKPIVALETDSRPAVSIGAAHLFSAVENGSSEKEPVLLPSWLC